MSLKIRLRQQGRTNRRSYRLVVADSRLRRDGKYVEKVGFYDPHMKEGKDLLLEHERLTYWIGKGAELSEKARMLVARGAPEIYRNLVNRELEKKKVAATKRKARTKKAAPAKAAAKSKAAAKPKAKAAAKPKAKAKKEESPEA